jgi:hypothetical protein
MPQYHIWNIMMESGENEGGKDHERKTQYTPEGPGIM